MGKDGGGGIGGSDDTERIVYRDRKVHVNQVVYLTRRIPKGYVLISEAELKALKPPAETPLLSRIYDRIKKRFGVKGV